MQQIHALNALDLPEIRVQIGSYLSFRDRKRCTLVCKDWHRDFQALVWELFPLFENPRADVMPHNVLAARQASIRKYAHLIKYVEGMSIFGDNPFARPFGLRFPLLNPLIEEHCRSLVTIKATVCDASAWAACMKLIQVNMRLREVDLTCTLPGGAPMVEVPLHKALVGHDRLVSLTLGCQTTATALLQILQACPSLRLLCVDGFLSPRSSPLSSADESSVDNDQDVEGSEDENDSSAQGENEEEEEEEGEEKQQVDDPEEGLKEPLLLSSSPFQLQSLRIRKTCDDPAIIQVLQHCPSLISLTLLTTQRISDALYKALEGNELDLPHLVKVYVNGRDPGNDSLEAFLKAFPRHQIRHVGLMNPTPMALQALVECQHQSLEVLLVNNPQDPTSLAMVPERCAQLKELVVVTPHLMDARCLIDRPWVCQQLETLLLPVGISKPNSTPRGPSEGGKEGSLTAEQVNELFFKQLGQLTRLRVLGLTRAEADTDDDDDDILSSELSPLMWHVASGLRHLATLASLEEVHLGLGIWELTEKDLQVMKECWPRLCALSYNTLTINLWDTWFHIHWPGLKVECIVL
ncbi:hypothetical protein DFQ27_001594 [Actinomortierella ambigua]|uniref:F-box domain-containing protein n=1 Tax=Actinomortierella ambigua TaxID=1343610 RepID=A0A9P6Q9W9_9FUNG|nr:hypothetical protein DFQ27_001594 [Actinomortierella ambigua]